MDYGIEPDVTVWFDLIDLCVTNMLVLADSFKTDCKIKRLLAVHLSQSPFIMFSGCF